MAGNDAGGLVNLERHVKKGSESPERSLQRAFYLWEEICAFLVEPLILVFGTPKESCRRFSRKRAFRISCVRDYLGDKVRIEIGRGKTAGTNRGKHGPGSLPDTGFKGLFYIGTRFGYFLQLFT